MVGDQSSVAGIPPAQSMQQRRDNTAQSQVASLDRHAAKVRMMEVKGSSGLSGGVPAKIEEGTEPDQMGGPQH